MDSARWSKVQELFEQALELKQEQVKPFLDEACGGDLELRNELLALLEADAEQSSLLERQAVELLDVQSIADLSGQQIGPYTLIKQIGYGGMGAVYLAERSDKQFKQQVALKLIKKGMDSAEILQRFQSERQILARLNHPNIATLYDGGVTDDGLPYFTMEYIKGEPIDTYCDKKHLSIRERLELFLNVLQAVQYAQRNLIVHRDLKPSNIIITDEGQVKLLDFGIAKLLADNPIDDSVEQTKTVFRIMTPGYASPEQIKGEPVTTASDVYSLGVILFEMLTGHRPYKTMGVSPAELESVICHTDPQKPSTVVTRIDDTVIGANGADSEKQISDSRRTSPERLKKLLSGDLDNICLKALQKAQERRYNSAEQLADDISRYLNGHPVLAKPSTFTYRLRKFVRRNRPYVTATAIAFAVIVALISFYTVRLSRERDRAQLEAEKARRITEYITSIFEVANPSEAKGDTITVRELIDEGAARIEEELASEPEVQIEIMTVIADVYYSLGLLEKSKGITEKSLQLSLEHYGKENINTANQFHNLGDVCYDLGEYPEADSLYNEALRIKEGVLEPNDTLIALELIPLGTVARLNSEFEKSRDLYERALEIQEAALTKPHADIAYTMNNLGRLYQVNGMYDKAEPLLVEGLQMRQELWGDYDFETVASTGSLASLYVLQGKYDEAAALYQKAYDNLVHMVGDQHHYVGGIMTSYGTTELFRKNYDRAEELFRGGLNILIDQLPEDHINIARPYEGLGRVFLAREMPDSALFYTNKALEIRRKSLPETNYMIASSRAYLGRAYYLKHEFSAAEEDLTFAYDIYREKYGDGNPSTQVIIGYLADLYQAMNQPDKALEFSSRLTQDR